MLLRNRNFLDQFKQGSFFVFMIYLLVLLQLQGCASRKEDKDALMNARIINSKNIFKSETIAGRASTKDTSCDVSSTACKTLAFATGFSEEGLGTWYGEDFRNKNTDSGELKNTEKLRASHRTLPMGSWVKVTNLENNYATLLKINDRGPILDNRIIDISYKAARNLGITRDTDSIKVFLEALDGDAFPALGGQDTVGVFLYYHEDNYHKSQELRRSLIQNSRMTSLENNELKVEVIPGISKQYPSSVRIGPFVNPWGMEVFFEQLRDLGYKAPVFGK